MKVTGNEGHHNSTFHIWFAHQFPYIYWMNSKLCFVDMCRLVLIMLKSSLYVVYKWFFNTYGHLEYTSGVPKVTGWSSYRSFLTITCPFVTVRTAGSLAPVLAQHKMWNRYPWGYRPWVRGMGSCSCTTQNVEPVSTRGISPWVRGMGTWHHPFYTGPPIYFKKMDRD